MTEKTLNDYQTEVLRTCSDAQLGGEKVLASFGLGIAGEAGECADLIKKHIGHGHELNTDKLKLELGDVLWYVAALANLINTPLSEVAQLNLDKLRKRYPEGFSTEASIARVDVSTKKKVK
jgi:NTP pyrophosphatase (non-canonical NTP hydrolase)